MKPDSHLRPTNPTTVAEPGLPPELLKTRHLSPLFPSSSHRTLKSLASLPHRL